MAMQCSSGKQGLLTFVYVVTMVDQAGLKGSPANIVADAMRLQPDRCLRCNLQGLHAHWVSSTFHRYPVKFESGISFKDQFDTQSTFPWQFGAGLGREAAWICPDALPSRSPGTLADLYWSIFRNLFYKYLKKKKNLYSYIDSSLSVVWISRKTC